MKRENNPREAISNKLRHTLNFALCQKENNQQSERGTKQAFTKSKETCLDLENIGIQAKFPLAIRYCQTDHTFNHLTEKFRP